MLLSVLSQKVKIRPGFRWLCNSEVLYKTEAIIQVDHLEGSDQDKTRANLECCIAMDLGIHFLGFIKNQLFFMSDTNLALAYG